MNAGPIVDAGPALNFFAARQERLLFTCVGGISVPESVREEIRAKATRDKRFQPAELVAAKLPEHLLQVLSDVETEELSQIIYRLERMPMRDRLRQRRDLGETMVIAHAVVAAQSGRDVRILIDEIRGSEVATAERRRLERMRQSGKPVGSLGIISTIQVLEHAAGLGKIQDRGVMRKVYGKLSALDDGLPPIDQTGLLNRGNWQHAPRL